MNFKYSLDGSTPKNFSGGWAKEAIEHGLPVSKEIAFDAFPKTRDRSPPLQVKAVVTGCEAMRVSNRSNSTVRAGLSQERLSRLAQLRELQRVPTSRP